MGLDDDEDCAEHVWVLDQLHPTSSGMQRVQVCGRCGTPAYDAGQATAREARPPL